jgi:hypothetical protein
MTAFLVIVIAGLLLALGMLRNQLRGLKADLECHKLGERLRQVINQAPGSAGAIEPFCSSWKNAA